MRLFPRCPRQNARHWAFIDGAHLAEQAKLVVPPDQWTSLSAEIPLAMRRRWSLSQPWLFVAPSGKERPLDEIVAVAQLKGRVSRLEDGFRVDSLLTYSFRSPPTYVHPR